MKCSYCDRDINKVKEDYYEGDSGKDCCEDCFSEYLSSSQYGFYDWAEAARDPDLMLDDELSDVEFFKLVKAEEIDV